MGARKFPYETVILSSLEENWQWVCSQPSLTEHNLKPQTFVSHVLHWRKNHNSSIFKFGVGCSPLVFPQITWTGMREAQVLHFLLMRKLWQTGSSFNEKYSSFLPFFSFFFPCCFFLSIYLINHKIFKRQEDFKIKEAFVFIVFFCFPL